ncbi:hypothetical protein HN446_00020 [bacterium]|jgi:hypothetical protein|nr:hypothetical protein [bacterium]
MKVIISKDKSGFYDIISCDSESMETLSNYLIEDVLEYYEGVLEWFYEPDKYSSIGELFDTEHIGNNVVISHEFGPGPICTISKNNFLKVINKWHEIMQKKPKKITITQEGDDFFFDVEY